MTEHPLIIQYTNLLHQYRDPKAEPVREFVRKHANDETFVKRAATLDKMFLLREQLVR
jgi:hypothetical protein